MAYFHNLQGKLELVTLTILRKQKATRSHKMGIKQLTVQIIELTSVVNRFEGNIALDIFSDGFLR